MPSNDNRAEWIRARRASPLRVVGSVVRRLVGVTPDKRGEGLGRTLYARFFEEVRSQGRGVVRCVTWPANKDSVGFHEALGFEVDRVVPDYDGPGEDRVLLVKRLS